MDTLLVSGDHYTDARGLPVALAGREELIQRVLIRLQVKKGSFLPDPDLGSELYRLPRSDSERTKRLALSYVQEALAGLSAVEVLGVDCAVAGEDLLRVTVRVSVDRQPLALEVDI